MNDGRLIGVSGVEVNVNVDVDVDVDVDVEVVSMEDGMEVVEKGLR